MTVFYRKYRPQTFAEMVGQEHVKKNLLAALTSGKISHGYLFSGSRGTGKTSTARIFAKAVNCEVYNKKDKKAPQNFGEPCNKCSNCMAITDGSSLDTIEIDAASNRGIDEIRDLREKIKLSPVSSRFKVYIIDEVHMLTTEAFNALLKTLEEPPAHVIFVLCTTEPGKLPETIISRLIRFNFSRASNKNIEEYVQNIAKSEKIKIEKSAIDLIAKASDGSFRDSASILEQLASANSEISEADVKAIVKTSGFAQILELLNLLFVYDLKGSVEVLEALSGTLDYQKLAADFVEVLKQILFLKIGAEAVLEKDGARYDSLKKLADESDAFEVKRLIKLMLIAESEIHIYSNEQMPIILAFCDFCEGKVRDNDAEGQPEVTVEKEEIKKEEVQESRQPEKVLEVNISSSSGEGLAIVEKSWGDFLGKVKPVNAHLNALLKSSKPASFDGKVLTLEVFFRFHKDKLEEPKIMTFLCDTISEVMGNRVVFKFILSDRKSSLPRPVSMSNVSDVDTTELGKVAQEIFAK